MNKIMSPQQAMDRLKDGNFRFLSGVRAVDSMMAHLRMADLATSGQKPFAIILTCSDSRSPAEMIFDQGVGDLFVVRVAGNVIASSLLASIEFAAANFGSPLIIVLGHSQCGAVKAAIDQSKDPGIELPSMHLEELIGRIIPSVERTKKKFEISDSTFVEKVTEENIYHSMKIIEDQSKIVRDLVAAGKLKIVGSVLDISTGKVNFL